eukprot:gene10266-11321_t
MTTSKKPEMQIIAGCFRGLNGHLVSFNHFEGSNHPSEIFRYMRLAIDPENNLARYDVPKAALNLLGRHAVQFQHAITDNYKYLFDHLYQWSQHSNKDMKVAGLKAMDSCLTQDILTRCHKILNSETSSSKEISFAINGYGLFAEACKKLLDESELKMMFQEVLSRSQYMYNNIENLTYENLQHLPGCLKALASIVQHMNEFPEVYLLPIQRIIVILFEHYPKLGKGGMFSYRKSLTYFIRALSNNVAIFKGCLSHIVYQGLIRTCSHPVVTEEGIAEESNQNESQIELSYRSFLDLWIALIDEKSYIDQISMDCSTKTRSIILKDQVYDELIQSVIYIIEKLNLKAEKEKPKEDGSLNVVQENSIASSSDPLSGLVADVPKDFQIFINLVEFCRTIILSHGVNSFHRWIPLFTKEVITLSSRYPLVSGFYKLLEICSRICSKLGYFKDFPSDKSNIDEKTVTFLLLKRFMKDILGRIKQFKEDLLSSCLQFILSLPVEVIEDNIHLLAMPMQITLQLGLSYHALAIAGIDALEAWSERISQDKMKQLLCDVLPCLDGYLRISSDKSETVLDDQDAILLSESSRGKRSRVPIKLLKALRDSSKVVASPLAQLRMRIVMFLGRLGGSLNMATVKERRVPDLRRAVAWDDCHHLSFALPFRDMKPTIYLGRSVKMGLAGKRAEPKNEYEVNHECRRRNLVSYRSVPNREKELIMNLPEDGFLPRVVELSLTTSDRQTKVVACEFLHALVLYMIGKSTQKTSQNAKMKGMEGLYQHIFPAVLRLGCDIEQEGLVSDDNSALRDFSAKCLKEFLIWSIKQTSQRKLSKSAVNPKAVFKRLYSISSHPNVFKRLGAALAFNNIYAVFREHDELIDVYTLELLVEFINSLALAHHDEAAVGTLEQGKEVLDHLKRIIQQKSQLLFKKSKNRRVPKSLKAFYTDDFSLDHVFEWLLRQCGTLSAQKWFENTIQSDGAEYLIHRFESGGYASLEHQMPATIYSSTIVFNIKDIVYWFERYLAVLDCYTWVAGTNLAKPSTLLLDESSRVLKTVEHFIGVLALSELEATKIRSKCTALVRTLDFLTITLNSGVWSDDKIGEMTSKIFVKELYEVILYCILEPEAVGFDIADIIVLQNLPEVMKGLCLAMKKALPPTYLSNFIKSLSALMGRERYDLLGQLPVDLGNALLANENFSRLEQLILGYQLFNATGMLKHVFQAKGCQSLCKQLLSNVVNGLMPLSAGEDNALKPIQKRLADRMLQLVFQLGIEESLFIDVVLDSKPVKDYPGTWTLSPRGAVFYHLFRSTVNNYILSREDNIVASLIEQGRSCPSVLSPLLQGILASCISKKKSQAIDRSTRHVVSQVLVKWNSLSSWWKSDSAMELKLASLNILKYLLMVDAEEAIKSVGLNASPVLSTFLQLLSDSTTGLAFKGQLIELLPLIFNGLKQTANAVISEALKRFIASSFPLSSADLPAGSSTYSEYLDCLGKLFKSLVMSASPILLEVLLTVIIKETDYVFNASILPAIVAYFKKLSGQNAEESLKNCFEILMDDFKYPNNIRRGVLERVMNHILQHLSTNVVRNFYKQNIRNIMQKIGSKLVKTSEEAIESQLITKIICFRLMSSLYSLLTKDDLMSKQSDIVKAYLPSTETGKELTQAITKACHAAKCEDCRGETICQSLRREYHCIAFNCLCSVIASTQTELKFYTGFLFTENLVKGQFLMDNIVDANKEFIFDLEQTAPFAKMKQLQMIRKQASSESTTDRSATNAFMPYLSSQYLMDSSLSQDVGQFDFSTPVQATEAVIALFLLAYSNISSSFDGPPAPPRNTMGRRVSDEANEVVIEAASSDGALEMDELNQHECMPVFVSLLNHMNDTGVYKHLAEGEEGCEMPSWMTCLHKKMNSDDTSVNVKLFILKLITNTPKIFEPFGKFWFSTIIQFIISGNIKGSVLNYFVIDAIVAMLSWSSTSIPEDSVVGRNMASSLLDVLLKNSHHNNRAVLKNNLQIIKTLTKVWKDRLDVTYRFIYEKFATADTNTKDNMTGIQLLGVILTNGFPPLDSRSGIDDDKYFATLTRNLCFKYKDVFASAAEVLGLAMKQTFEHEKSTNSPLFAYTYERLSDLSANTMDKFIMCLHRIQINFPAAVNRFVPKLLFSLPSLHGVLKQQCLETLASIAENFDEPTTIFMELKSKGLEAALNHRDEGLQVAALSVFNGLLRSLTPMQILPFLHTISRSLSSASTALRNNIYEMFMWIYDVYRADDPDEMKEKECFDVLKISKEVLLLGINDQNTDISLKVLNFWRHETRLPTSTIERLIEILRALYSTKTEKEYLSYSTNLLLQLTSLSPDYNLPLFNEPLDSAKRFQDYPVNFSWQRQRIAMTPLFAGTMNQSQSPSQSQGGSSVETGMLRATQQNMDFTPTQEQGSSSSVNWMNPSFQVGSLPSQSQPQTQAAHQSTLLFVSQKKRHRRTDFNQGTLKLSSTSNANLDEIDAGAKQKQPQQDRLEILRLKKRFLKSQEQSRIYFASRERRSQQLRQSALQRQKAGRDSKVIMYRNYRQGELPDIQIKHSELIVPLQALAQHDSVLARRLFGVLLDAVISELPAKLSEDVMKKACADIQTALDTMVNSSVAFHPPFVYAIEDACVRQKSLKLDPASVTTACCTSLQQPIGIVLLEKQIIQNCDLGPRASKHSGQLSDDVMTWIETAKLYKSIELYDFVHCIFSEQVTKQEKTRLALEAEGRNDYHQALKLYNQLSIEDWSVSEPSGEEQEFWDTARLECYNNLGQWSNLQNLTLQNIDEDSPADISKIWNDAFLQEQFLPFYIRSNVKLLCQGKTDAGEAMFSLFLEHSLREDEYREFLESRYSDDLALIRIMQDNGGAATHYINIGLQNFIEEWSNLSLLMTSSRLRALSKLQRLYEMKEFSDVFFNQDSFSCENIEEMLGKWSKRLPDKTQHTVLIWDDVITNRCMYMRKMKQKFKDLNSDDYQTVLKRLDMEESRNLLLLADVARHQVAIHLLAHQLLETTSIHLLISDYENR